MATLCTFGASTVVICRRCTSLHPAGGVEHDDRRGCRRPTQASMAAEPVSPDVATTIVRRSPRRSSSASMSRPTSWRATSLKASVGPWNSSMHADAVAEVDEGDDVGVLEVGVGVVDVGGEVGEAVDVRRHHRGGEAGVVAVVEVGAAAAAGRRARRGRRRGPAPRAGRRRSRAPAPRRGWRRTSRDHARAPTRRASPRRARAGRAASPARRARRRCG